ncbi:hypothetical protein ICW40_18850 [Actinotalea ferrariae]|uniref:helix-turn-helix transcriptional regulator n=1 Tax=Actinotalea ferrariae TaxID=1386098 RepID=UPI001C8BD36B|nr:LuxR C-terminal-related transcriptional regulator [Actinotalea ferrariae]MBX9246853.1 hypothetical protein [Actinotalea ferrariae]
MGRTRDESADDALVHGAPRLPSWLVPRPRLVAALDDGAPLTVVRAPAGGGKTVLLAEWAWTSSAAPRRAWVDVDSGRVARTALWAHVVEVLDDAGWVQPEHVLAHGVEALRETRDLPALMRRALGQLGPLVLVVDGADRLEASTASDLVALAATLPGLRVVVAVRGGDTFESPDVRLQVDVTVVPDDALALDVAETAAMLDVPPDEARAVHRATGGLPLATRVVQLARTTADLGDPTAALSRLVASLMSALDPGTQQLVRLTAAADSLTHELAAELTGDAGAGDLLDTVAERGLGTWSGGDGGAVFRYTTVVRHVVRQAMRTADPQGYAEVRRRVALWCHDHRRPLEALEAAVDADDLDLVSAVIARHWYDLMSLHAGQVRPVLSTVAVHRLRRHPFALFYLAITENADRHRRRQAAALFGLAVAAARLHRSRASAADQVRLRLVELVALRLTGQRRALLHAARALARLVAELPLADRTELRDLLPVAHAQIGLAFLYTARYDDAVAQFQLGLSAAPQPTAGLHNLACLAGTHALVGDVGRARTLVADARGRTWPEGWRDGYMGSMYRLAEACLALEDLDAERAQEHLDAFAPHVETIEHWPLVARVQAITDLVAGRPDAALERFDATRRLQAERRSTTPLRAQELDVTRSLLLVAAGQVHTALSGPAETAGDPATAVALARAQLVGGLPDKALATLARVADRPATRVRTRAEHAVLEAAVLAELGREQDAADALARAAALLEVHGLRLPLVLVRERDRRAFDRLARDHGLATASRVLSGGPFPDVVPDSAGVPLLTPRERVVLEALTRTGSASDIAGDLQVSTHTVKSQLRTLYRKLGANSRETALAAARRLGALPVGPDGDGGPVAAAEGRGDEHA